MNHHVDDLLIEAGSAVSAQAVPLEVATSLDMLDKTSDAASEEAIRGQDASIAAKQYTQPALLVEPTIEPEVELDRYAPGRAA